MQPEMILLAGGKGTRLAGTWDGPKCLAPVAGRPAIEWVFEQFERDGFREFCVAIAHGREDVAHYLRSHPRGSSRVRLSCDPGISADAAASCVLREFTPRFSVIANADTLFVGPFCLPPIDRDVKCVRLIDAGTALHTGVTIYRKGVDVAAQDVRGFYPFVDIGTPEGLLRANIEFGRTSW